MTTMEGSDAPRVFNTYTARPSTPPITPGSRSQPRYPSMYSHTSPVYANKRYGIFQSPPLEHIEPTGGHQFNYTRSEAEHASSRPSSASGLPRAASVRSSVAASVDSTHQTIFLMRTVTKAEFELVDFNSEDDSDAEVVLPDTTEEALSEDEDHAAILRRFRDLKCHDGDDQARRYREKKKRWSAGLYKRTHSQSIEGDSDNEDVEGMDGHDVGMSARRLRRRVRGPGDRSSLIFEDISNLINADVKEEEELTEQSDVPPELSGDMVPLESLPFWVLEDMVLDSDSESSHLYFAQR